jgi:mono/diheme cytochrome c family protein
MLQKHTAHSKGQAAQPAGQWAITDPEAYIQQRSQHAIRGTSGLSRVQQAITDPEAHMQQQRLGNN